MKVKVTRMKNAACTSDSVSPFQQAGQMFRLSGGNDFSPLLQLDLVEPESWDQDRLIHIVCFCTDFENKEVLKYF